MVRVRSWDSWWVRALRKPVLHRFYLNETSRTAVRVRFSPYPYGPCPKHHDCWVLTPLGILHRWTGMTLNGPTI